MDGDYEALRAKIDSLNEQALAAQATDTYRTQALSAEALALAATIDPPYPLGQARALAMQVNGYMIEGDYRRVIQQTTELQRLYQSFPHDHWYCSALYCLGLAFQQSGQPTEALKVHQHQLDVARALQYTEEEANALRRIGVAHDTLRRPDLALQYYSASRDAYQRLGSSLGVAAALNNMAIVYSAQGQCADAIALGTEALHLFEAGEFVGGQIATLGTLVEIYLKGGDLDHADQYARRAVQIARQYPQTSRLIEALSNYGQVLTAQQRVSEALDTLSEALHLAETANQRIMTAQCLRALSGTYALQGDTATALDYFRRYHELQTAIFEEASSQRYENLEVLYQTEQAQLEVENQRRLREDDRRYHQHLGEMKDDLLSTATHDLKNPLAAMKLALHLLSDHIDAGNAEGQLLMATLEKSVSQMQSLVVDLLELARLQTGAVSFQPVALDIVAFVRQATSEHVAPASAKGLSLEMETNVSSYVLKFDPNRMNQVMANLLGNAIKYTPSGGIRVEVRVDTQQVEVSVSDTGLGIPASDLPAVFRRFYRVQDPRLANIEGTGLGLTICQSVIEQHDGRIWAESTVGVGSRFAFSLPIAARTTTPA